MTAIKFFELDRIESLAADLKAKGYLVELDKRIGDVTFDIVAQKGSERVAYEVKAGTHLAKTEDFDLRHMREVAAASGIKAFRLVVVNPPREKDVIIDGLEDRLLEYILDNMPNELELLAAQVSVTGISSIDVSEIEVEKDAIRAHGVGTVEIALTYGGGDAKEGSDMTSDFPFVFDVVLDRELNVTQVNELTVNTNSFYE